MLPGRERSAAGIWALGERAGERSVRGAGETAKDAWGDLRTCVVGRGRGRGPRGHFRTNDGGC
jgi:hypothetical protein